MTPLTPVDTSVLTDRWLPWAKLHRFVSFLVAGKVNTNNLHARAKLGAGLTECWLICLVGCIAVWMARPTDSPLPSPTCLAAGLIGNVSLPHALSYSLPLSPPASPTLSSSPLSSLDTACNFPPNVTATGLSSYCSVNQQSLSPSHTHTHVCSASQNIGCRLFGTLFRSRFVSQHYLHLLFMSSPN